MGFQPEELDGLHGYPGSGTAPGDSIPMLNLRDLQGDHACGVFFEPFPLTPRGDPRQGLGMDKVYNATREHVVLRTKTSLAIVQESAGRVMRIAHRSTWRCHKTSMMGPSSDLQQHAKASNDADPVLVESAQLDMFRMSSSRRST